MLMSRAVCETEMSPSVTSPDKPVPPTPPEGRMTRQAPGPPSLSRPLLWVAIAAVALGSAAFAATQVAGPVAAHAKETYSAASAWYSEVGPPVLGKASLAGGWGPAGLAFSFQTTTPTTTPMSPAQIEAAPLEDAMKMIEGMSNPEVAHVFEEMGTGKVIKMMGKMDLPKASHIWGEMEPVKAGAVFEEVPDKMATQIVGILPEPTLVPRLPEVSAGKLWRIPLEVLIDNLPSVPVTHLDSWNRPDVDADLPPPVQTLVSETSTVYSLPEAREAKWALMLGSPAPFTAIWAKFKRASAEVRLRVDDLAGQPEGTPTLPRGRVSDRFLRVSLENMQADAISVVAATAFVQKSWIDANQIQKWSIQFNRLDEAANTWVPFPSKRMAEDAERVYFSVVVPGFSTLAITGSRELPEQVFTVTDLDIQPRLATPGEPITISAKVVNSGEEPAVFPADLWINQSIEATTPILVEAGGTAEFAFTVARPAGQYRVRIERALLDFTVAAPRAPVRDTRLLMAAVVALATLVLLGASSLAAWRR